VALELAGSVAIPPFADSAFDHGDVVLETGRIFVAHTAAGTVEVVDADGQAHVLTLPGCPEASGVLCAQGEGLVFAAARAAGKVLVIDAASLTVLREVASGPRPNGLAWDGRRGRLLAADVEDCAAHLLDPSTGANLGTCDLPGRPRWCVYDERGDRFLVNVREPAGVALLAAEPFAPAGWWPVPAAGPHGLDLDIAGRRAFVASDGGRVSMLDLASGSEVARASIAGAPDAIWYNAERRLLYVAIGEPGLVDVVDTATMTRREQVPTEEGAHTTAFDRERQRLAVFLPHTCRVALYRETGA
jgi:DNA-binding beta-propeller fold protein YncE